MKYEKELHPLAYITRGYDPGDRNVLRKMREEGYTHVAFNEGIAAVNPTGSKEKILGIWLISGPDKNLGLRFLRRGGEFEIEVLPNESMENLLSKISSWGLQLSPKIEIAMFLAISNTPAFA